MSKQRLQLLAILFASLALGSILLAACTRPGSSPIASSTPEGGAGGGNTTVQMGLTSFLQTSITIPKGSMLTLVDTVAVPHIIMNGSWDTSGAAKPAKETGAPTVNQSFSGNDTHQIGPFTTAGTYHLYCTIHQNMNLTVIVTNGSGSSAGSGGGNGATVKLGLVTFEQTSVTISKGSMLTLVDTVAVAHIIMNGSWDASGAAKPAKEAGAPTVNQSFSGNDTHQIGPFTTAGTYHLYCTIHQNMNLTVIVTG
jgi:plastocyanin